MKRASALEVLAATLALCVSVGLCPLTNKFAAAMAVMLASNEWVATHCVPTYPGVALISEDYQYTATSGMVRRVYRSSAGLEEVRTYLENKLPGFRPDNSQLESLAYANGGDCQDGLVTAIARYADWAGYYSYNLIMPAASIRLYVDVADPTATLIEVNAVWFSD